jgi:hypothetical protein
MVKRPYVLWLIWQNIETRQRYHIGNLSSLNGEYTFSYELSGKRRTLFDAINDGYKLHLAFRDINKVYKSDRLFDAFARRLPDKRRPDFHELLQSFGLSKDYTDMDLLRATGGRLATDPYEFVSPIYKYNDHFDFDFYIAGWRYYEGEKVLQKLKINDEVRFELDLENPKDSKAVAIFTRNSDVKLGFVPAFYSGFMYDVIKNNGKYSAKIEQVNTHAKSQLKVKIIVSGQSTVNGDKDSEFDVIEQLAFI